MNIIVLDTETTGLFKYRNGRNPSSITKMGSEVISFGGLVLTEELKPEKGFCHFCDCIASHSDSKAFERHNLYLEEIRSYVGGTFFEEVVWENLPEIFSDNLVIIGYNTPFDISMIGQSCRDFPYAFPPLRQVTNKFPVKGRWYIDIMLMLGQHKQKLSSFDNYLKPHREKFFEQYSEDFIVESNCPQLYRDGYQNAHNAFYDSLNTYLIFLDKVWNKKIIRGGMSSAD